MSRWRPSRTFVRYVALEAPGWLLAGALLWALVEWDRLEPALAALLLGLWVAKDFALYPWLRQAYEATDPDATAALIGRTGVARDRVDPSGYVRVGSELWRAELAPDCGPLEPGDGLRVRRVRGLTLVVEPLADAGPTPPSPR